MTAAERTWGDLRPERLAPWQPNGERVTVLVPRFGHGRVAAVLQKWFSPAPYKLHLDDVGSFAWARFDGAHTLGEVAREMRAAFGEAVEPIEERLVLFLQRLDRGNLVRFD